MKHLKLWKNNFIFIMFIFVLNILFSDIHKSFIVGIHLFLAIDYTYIMSHYFNSSRLRNAFKYMLYPLKIFKVDIDNLTLIISISLAFIPILADEASKIKLSLTSKGQEFKINTIFTKPHIYLITFLNSLFDRVDELEKSLQVKMH